MIFRPKNLILFIQEYVEGNFVEKIEWPMNKIVFKSQIKIEETEEIIREKESIRKIRETQNEIAYAIVKLIIEDQTSNLTMLAEGKLQFISQLLDVIPQKALDTIREYCMNGLFAGHANLRSQYAHIVSIVLNRM